MNGNVLIFLRGNRVDIRSIRVGKSSPHPAGALDGEATERESLPAYAATGI